MYLSNFCQVYIVSGGYGSTVLDSTETLLKNGGTSWQYAARLPTKRYLLRGVALDHGKFLVTGEYCENKQILLSNMILYTGGYYGSTKYSDTLVYDLQSNRWSSVGQLSSIRYLHAISMVPGETMDYCI